MRIANVAGRACLVTPTGGVDLFAASDGRFPDNVDAAIGQLDEIAAWFAAADPALDPDLSTEALLDDLSRLGPPVTRPPQIFAIGLNYADHAEETGLELPSQPMVFTKFASSLAGPGAEVPVLADTIDWEVELVAVIGSGGRDIAAADAWSHIAGFCIGQDVSERRLQMASAPAQFSLAKSLRNYSPIGPWITTLDELENPGDLAISCRRDDEVLQSSRTTSLIFDVPSLVEYLSAHVELLTGDLIFTGTPDGVGVGRRPRVFIQPGWEIRSAIEGLGHLHNPFVA
jgi:2-keto-4-pentenoate hydratase/2-oxohepta-3-ene-1,7-dioic acid hydratase in catechol pathway